MIRSTDPRTPCVIGVATRTWHPAPSLAPEPLAMWAEVARAAVRDAGGKRDVLAAIDDLGVVHCQSWTYDDPALRLAERLALAPGRRSVSILAGTAPQRLVNAAACRMLAGETSVALVVGGEALHSVAVARRAGEPVRWSHPHPTPPAFPIDLDEWMLPTELRHGVLPAWLTFALLDDARSARRETPAGVRARECAATIASASEVAATNPDAWFRARRAPDEVARPHAHNRMVAEPYTKLMTAMMDVDMAAAIVLATHETAEALGVPHEQRVYLRGWAFGRDATHVAGRHALHESVAMRATQRRALAIAGADVDDVSGFDLYSCFPVAVDFARDALGITADDARPVTLTGGLALHGGPSANYLGHSIAAMVRCLRERPDELAMVTGIGMHMTKHVVGVYSTAPAPVAPPDDDAVQASIDQVAPSCPVLDHADGPATVLARTVLHERERGPAAVVAVCETPAGERVYARSETPDVVAAFAGADPGSVKVELAGTPAGTNDLRLP